MDYREAKERQQRSKRRWNFIAFALFLVAPPAGVGVFIANTKINSFTFAQSITDSGVGSANFLSFGFIVFAYSALFFFLASLILKSFSSRSRNIPF